MFKNTRQYLPPDEPGPGASAQETLKYSDLKRNWLAVSGTHPEGVQSLIYSDVTVVSSIGAVVASVRDAILGEAPIQRF